MALTLPTNWLTVNYAPTAAEVDQLFDAITQAYGVRASKTGDETVTTSTTLQNDDELTVAVSASTVYEVALRLYVHGNATADIKVALTFPSGTVQGWGGLSIVAGSAGVSTSADVEAHAFTTLVASPTSSLTFGVPDTNGTLIICWATVSIGATAGSITLQWAQNSSSSTTTINAGSRLVAYAD